MRSVILSCNCVHNVSSYGHVYIPPIALPLRGEDCTFWPRFATMVLLLPGFWSSGYLFQRILKGYTHVKIKSTIYAIFRSHGAHAVFTLSIRIQNQSFCCVNCHHAFWNLDTIYLMIFDTIYLMIFDTIYIMIFCTNCVISVSQTHLVPYVKTVAKTNMGTPQPSPKSLRLWSCG